MSKRKETYEIEETLYNMVYVNRLYGCSEVTIGFYNNGHGDEIVDFCTMNSKGIIKCYEIKVTLADFKSKAKLSWYGHYNYLVVSEELLSKLTDELINEHIPKYVGIAIPAMSNSLKIIRRARKQDLSNEDEIMIKESLIRSLTNKLFKSRQANNIVLMSELKRMVSKQNKVIKKTKDDYESLYYKVCMFERYLRQYYDKDFSIDQFYEQFFDRQNYLDETITLNLSDSGKKYNTMVTQYKQYE